MNRKNSYTRLLCGQIHYVWNERHLKLTWGFHNLVFKVCLDRNQICIDCIVCTAQAAHCWFGPTTVCFLPIYVLSSGWCGLLLSCVWFVFYFDCVVVFSCCQCFDGFYLVAVTCSLHTQVLSFGFTDLLWPVTCYSLLLYPPLFLILCHRNILYHFISMYCSSPVCKICAVVHAVNENAWSVSYICVCQSRCSLGCKATNFRNYANKDS